MNKKDVRWRQRFQNYQQALSRLNEAVALSRQRALSDLEQQGLVQAFEFTHELAWNVLKDYLEEQGYVGIIGSKNATREAFKNGLLEDGESWMDMIKARNLTSHTYHTKIAETSSKTFSGVFTPPWSRWRRALRSWKKRSLTGYEPRFVRGHGCQDQWSSGPLSRSKAGHPLRLACQGKFQAWIGH